MRRREMLKAMFAGGICGLSVSMESAGLDRHERITPITGPDHPLAPRRTLVYGLGTTASSVMRKSLEQDFLHDDWAMWADIPNDQSEHDVLYWGTDLYPFTARNMSRLSILARLGDRGADMVAPTVHDWRHIVPVEVMLIELLEDGNHVSERIARRQRGALEAIGGFDLVTVGCSEEEAHRFFEIRAGFA